jgi:hypothetical protein
MCVDRAPSVSSQFKGLHRVQHGAERQVLAVKGNLASADARRSILAEGGEDVSLSGFESGAYQCGELSGFDLELLSRRHDGSLPVERDPIRRLAKRITRCEGGGPRWPEAPPP